MRYALGLLVAFVFLGGCAANYVTPAAGVSLAEFTDDNLLAYYDRQAASPFPANLAVLRVQDSDHYSYTGGRRDYGRYAFITSRDIESDTAIEKMNRLPLVRGIAPIGRLLLPPNATSLADLRTPAAQLRADMLLVYTVDTTFTVDGKSLGPLSLISLGMIPNKNAHVTATVSGILIDVRSGFVYGTAEATERESQRASIWSTELAIDTARRLAEENAFESFVDEFGNFWTGVLNIHAATTPGRSGATGKDRVQPEIEDSGWYSVSFGSD